jgi:glycosyltransferase involved in cell wall biosynthesis
MLLGFPTATSQEEVRSWISREGLEEAVVITGERDDVAACVSAMDLGLVASLWSETIARAALEIMSCGVPLVGTDVGVMPDLFPDDALTRPGDPKAMADLLARALTDGALLGSLRDLEARRMDDLDAASFLDKTMALYREA